MIVTWAINTIFTTIFEEPKSFFPRISHYHPRFLSPRVFSFQKPSQVPLDVKIVVIEEKSKE